MTRTLIAALILSSGCLIAGASCATDNQNREATQMSVSVKDVNFADAGAVRSLYTRLTYAAKNVCDSDAADPQTANTDRACERDAVSDAVRQIGHVELSRLDDNARGTLRDGDQRTTLAMNDNRQ